MRVAAVIVAAGSSKRMGAGLDKLLIPIKGKTILEHSVMRFEKASAVDEVVIVTRKELVERVKSEMMNSGGYKKVKAVVAGGEKRQDSVKNGLGAISDSIDIILIHDAARPAVSPAAIDRVVEAAAEAGGAVLAAPCTDTVKQVTDGEVIKTLPRDNLMLAQTPQGFRKEILLKAVRQSEADEFVGSDEASIVERTGGKIAIVVGDSRNIKVTSPADVAIVESLLSEEVS